RLAGKVTVPQLLPQLAPGDLSILNCDHHIIRGPPEVLADRFSVVGDDCNFHGLFSFCSFIFFTTRKVVRIPSPDSRLSVDGNYSSGLKCRSNGWSSSSVEHKTRIFLEA